MPDRTPRPHPPAGPPHACTPRRRVLGAGLGLLLAGRAAATPHDGAIAVVVGRGQAPAGPMSPATLAGIFGRKRQLWEDGRPIVPVNLPAAHPLRRGLSQQLFHRSPEDLLRYWSEQAFHGVLPPLVLASEEAVLRYLAATPGAIGYVAACNADARVDTVALLPAADSAGSCGA